MNETNLLATLARLSSNASFVIAALICYFKQQRGLEEIAAPTFELKTEKDWAVELASLTPEEITTMATLIELFKTPTPTLSSGATYVITSAISSLEQEAAKPYITTPTDTQKTGEQWAAQLATLSPQNIAKTASVISYARDPATYSTQNLTLDPVTGISPLTEQLNRILRPILPVTPLSLNQYLARREQLNKMIDDHFKKREAEIAAAKKAAVPKKPPTVKPPAEPKPITVKPSLTIERIPYPKWWRDSHNAQINLTAPTTHTLATVSGKLRLFVATIVLTVTGETQITFTFGDSGIGGPFYLGGEGQPMGMVIAMGNSPAPCGRKPLTITATDPGDANPSIGGFATVFVETDQ